MWIQVRSMDGKKSVQMDGLSKLTKIEDLRKRLTLTDEFDVEPDRQRLFYRGKQLEDGHTLFDYDVGLNAIIQILVRQIIVPKETSEDKENVDSSNKENQEPAVQDEATTSSEELDSLYKMGDVLDVRDETMAAWFEGKICKVSRANSEKTTPSEKTALTDKQENKNDCNANVISTEKEDGIAKCPWDSEITQKDGFVYHIIYEGYEEDDHVEVSSRDIRPRANHKIPFNDIKEGDKVMVNYNYDEPERRGYWYDAVVTEKRNTRTIKELYCTVFVGKDLIPMEKCHVLFRDEVFQIEKPGTQLNTNTIGVVSPAKRTNKPDCDHCLDNPRRKCKFCSCNKCGVKENPEKTLLCDECDAPFHIYCLNPPLEVIPDVDEWYCPECKNDASEVVQAGEKLKSSKKKSKMASASSTSNRDWGKGMACVGRSKICTMVPPNHFGSIPGIEVGACWKFRVQASESGVHRPHVAGIHGREDEGSYSIVLSGGYEDDKDDGEDFTYTGSGGRDLSGNKRTAEQSCDQTLTRMNAALAKNCNAPKDKVNGGTSKEWQKGKPVRVVRNCKGRKHSKYAPEEGNRYDGLYKVVKYWPAKGKSGFIVWRYLLRRDDPSAAPWTKAGQKKIKELGITMVYPEGWLEAQERKEKEKKEKEESEGKESTGSKKGRKRKRIQSDDEDEEKHDSPVKKKSTYTLDQDVSDMIEKDAPNKKIWDEALSTMQDGAQKFIATVEELFGCICCQDVVFKPVTTACNHNVCESCLKRAFKAEVYSCPACREDLGKDTKLPVNKTLADILTKLFPGYESGRD